MKSANPSAPRVIFVIGIPGAGKTFFAEKFSINFGAPFIEAEQIRRILSDQPSYSPEEDLVVDDLSKLQLELLMKTKKTIVFEGATEARTDRQDLVKLVKKHGYEPIIVWVQTDSATSERRATRGTRGHSKASLVPLERFDYLYSRFTPPNEAEKAVVISGKHTVSSQAKVVLKQMIQAKPKTELVTQTVKSTAAPVSHPQVRRQQRSSLLNRPSNRI